MHVHTYRFSWSYHPNGRNQTRAPYNECNDNIIVGRSENFGLQRTALECGGETDSGRARVSASVENSPKTISRLAQ